MPYFDATSVAFDALDSADVTGLDEDQRRLYVAYRHMFPRQRYRARNNAVANGRERLQWCDIYAGEDDERRGAPVWSAD